MRATMIFSVLGLCALTGCAAAKEEMKKVEANPSMMKGAEDDTLLVAVKGELAKDPKTKSAGINATVKGGVVTLTGSASADVKTEAEKVAKVPGVSSVTNQITVK